MAVRAPLALLVAACVLASCGSSRASLGLAVSPDPVAVDLVHPCAGVFAMFPCSASNYLHAKMTVTVATMNAIGGRGTIEVRAIDAAGGGPLPEPAGVVTGEVGVLLGPHASVALPIEWKRNVSDGGPGRIPPSQLSFLVTVELTDVEGHHVSETATVREKLPRAWQIF